MSVSKILAHGSLHMVLENYQNFIEMTSKMIHIVALGGGFKFPCKIHLNTQWGVVERTPFCPLGSAGPDN